MFFTETNCLGLQMFKPRMVNRGLKGDKQNKLQIYNMYIFVLGSGRIRYYLIYFSGKYLILQIGL